MHYNSQQKRLILPEYGRNVQQMVDHCLTLEDRDERTRCAYSIIAIMGNLFPHLRDVDDFKTKLWDHLVVMSNFQLDIDYPCEVIKEENLYTQPEKIAYGHSSIRYRHYGKFVENMIAQAQEMPEGEERDQLLSLLANYMKKSLLSWNKECAENEKVFADLREYSRGRIVIDQSVLKLREGKEQPTFRKNKNQSKKMMR